MNEIKQAVKHLAIIYLLAVLSMPLTGKTVHDVFPVRNLDVFYWLILASMLFLYYNRISIAGSKLRFLLLGIASMIVLLIVLRGLKYMIFSEVDILCRYLWYLYYVPMLMIPSFLFYIFLLLFEQENQSIPLRWSPILIISISLILLILTNDIHQLVFRFQPGFLNWDSSYSYGPVFYVIMFWQYGVAIAAILGMIIKSRIRGIRNHAWLLLVPMLIGGTCIVLVITNKMPAYSGNMIEVPESYCILAAGVLECCLCLGLIPSNEEHNSLFQLSSIGAQITDHEGNIVYKSDNAITLTEAELQMEDGGRLQDHMILRKKAVPGGYGYWTEDVSVLDELNTELFDTGNRLAEEMALVKLQNELQEKQSKLHQRSVLYDTIAQKTQVQSRKITQIAEGLQRVSDNESKDTGRKQITALATYIKRFANLMLLSESGPWIDSGEVALAFSEVLRRLNRCGICGDIHNSAKGAVSAGDALYLFEVLENLIEENFSAMKGIYVTLTEEKDHIHLRALLEGPTITKLPASYMNSDSEGLPFSVELEDDCTYLSFILQKGECNQ